MRCILFFTLLGVSAGVYGVDAVYAQGSTETFRLEVDDAQRVTMAGFNPSLEAVLDELSWRAGFELRGFGLEDRSVTVRMEALPLRNALQRLLGRDAYLAGVAVDKAGSVRIAWLAVPGPKPSVRVRHRSRSRTTEESTVQFRVPPGLFLAAFEGKDDAQRIAALQTIEARVLGDPMQRQAFLLTDSRIIADAIARYPEAPAILESIAVRQSDISLRQKLNEVVTILKGEPGAAPMLGSGPSRWPTSSSKVAIR